MPKALHITLNVIRGLFLAGALAATVAAMIEDDTESRTNTILVFVSMAISASAASISLSPRLWTAAPTTVTPGHGSVGSTTVAAPPPQPNQPPPPVQTPPTAAPPPQHGQPQPPAHGQPGQVYGGGTYQGQVYGQPGAGASEPPHQPSPPPDWQQHR